MCVHGRLHTLKVCNKIDISALLEIYYLPLHLGQKNQLFLYVHKIDPSPRLSACLLRIYSLPKTTYSPSNLSHGKTCESSCISESDSLVCLLKTRCVPVRQLRMCCSSVFRSCSSAVYVRAYVRLPPASQLGVGVR